MKLTVDDVCTATGGTLACGHRDLIFTSVSIDSRAVVPGSLFIPLSGTKVDGHAYLAAAVRQGATGFLFAKQVEPGLPDGAAGIAVRDTLSALQDLSAWHRNRLSARVIGIAGSNGKTTTKELLAQVCAVRHKTLATQGNQNNHIGLPLTLLQNTPCPGMGSFKSALRRSSLKCAFARWTFFKSPAVMTICCALLTRRPESPITSGECF